MDDEGGPDDTSGPDESDAPTRLCPRCSTQSRTSGEYCPQCGASFIRRRRRPSKRVAIVSGLVAILVLAGAGVGIALKVSSDNRAEAERQRQTEQAERERAEEADRQQAEAEAEQALEDVQLAGREDLETGLEEAITEDAEGLVADGLLDGPILETSCDPTGGGSTDPAATTGQYECIAVNEENDDGTSSGYTYTGTINYEEFTFTWQIGP